MAKQKGSCPVPAGKLLIIGSACIRLGIEEILQ